MIGKEKEDGEREQVKKSWVWKFISPELDHDGKNPAGRCNIHFFFLHSSQST